MSECANAHAMAAPRNTFGSVAVPTTATATADATTHGAMTLVRPKKSDKKAPGPIPNALVAAIAVNSAPRPAGVYPCSCTASRGSRVARPPAPLKKSAAFKPLTAKKSRRRSSRRIVVCAFSPLISPFDSASSSPALLATFTSPVAAAAASRSASPSSIADVFGLVLVPSPYK